jgi:RHS repeat-associated protein
MNPRTTLSTFIFASLCVLSLAAAPVQSSAPAQAPPSAKAPPGTNAPSAKTIPSASLRSRGILPVSSWTASPEEEAYLNGLFSIAHEAAMNIPPSAQRGFLARTVEDVLAAELSTWVTTNGDSAWAPGVRLVLGRRAELRCQYLSAMTYFRSIVERLAVVAQTDPASRSMAREAASRLARLLALTGQLAELNTLEASALPVVGGGSDWNWAREMRPWATKHPDESYKCGLYCLDQLGRLTAAPGTYLPSNVLETKSSANGWTAADLVHLGTQAGLNVQAYAAVDMTNLPVPSVVHLASEHFVVVRRREGMLYEVYDPVAFGPKMITPEELAVEATGCVLASAASVAAAGAPLAPLDPGTAATYRGRCHGPLPLDHLNSPCTTCPCPPGGSGNGSGPIGSGANSSGSNGSGANGAACSGCGAGPQAMSTGGSGTESGMATWFVSEPYLNLWVKDTPLSYSPPLGPPLNLTLSHTDRVEPSVVSGQYTQGATLETGESINVFWACSLLSYAELDGVQDTVDIAMPNGGWSTFTFTNASGSYDASSFIAYSNNSWVEQVGTTSTGTPPTSLVLHLPDGSQCTYGVCDTAFVGWLPSYTIYFVSGMADPAGNTTTFSYDGNFNLTNVAAADGTSFALQFTNSTLTNLITGVATSYGASAHFDYYIAFSEAELTNITDAVGMNSQFGFDLDNTWALDYLATPYGTTSFYDFNSTWFDRIQQITLPDGSVEFWAQLNQYTGLDWPAFASGQIPTNTPVGTLDSGTNRWERNTFYWNAAQWAPFTNQALSSLTLYWTNLMTARIRHYLASTEPSYSHWVAISSEQNPSPDGGTTEGQITWYDYVGKPSGQTNEVGAQVQPSVIARVMPDGSTWYDSYIRNTNGLPIQEIEHWFNGGADHFRTNTWTYAANGIDLTQQIGPLGESISSNWFNSNHQIVTNYDALGQMTTFTYDPSTLQLTSVTRPSGLSTTNLFDSNHRLETTIGTPIDRTNSFTWNSSGDVATFTDERNMTVTKFWDGLHRPTGSAYPDGTTTTNLYTVGAAYPNSSGGTTLLDLTAAQDRLGKWTEFAYDALRRKTAETNANGIATTFGYCECGALTSVTRGANTSLDETTTYVLDDEPRLTQIYYPDGSSVTNTLDLLGRVVVTSDSMGSVTNTFDNLGRLAASSNAFGQLQALVYDAEDNLTNQTDANGVVISSGFDSLHRLTSRAYPDGGIEGFAYNAKGLVTYTNQLGYKTWQTLDTASRKTAETNANLEVTQYKYDPSGSLTNLTDPKSNKTVWHYDLYGRATNKVDAAGTVIIRYSYDADDRLTNRWMSATGNTGYGYDPVGNLTNVVYPGQTVRFQYDALNRRTNMVDAVGTTAWTYFAGGLPASESEPFSTQKISYAYTNRLRSSLTLSQTHGSWVENYAYDSARRLLTNSSDAGAFTYRYQGAGFLVTNLALPNTSHISNTFDDVARLTGTYLTTSGGTVRNSHGYTYNTASQRTQQTRTDSSTVGYTYDPIGQLKTAVGSGGASTENLGYAYDHAWNLSALTNAYSSTNFGVNSDNEMTSDGGYSMSYNANGDMTWSDRNALYYYYGAENRLTNVTDSMTFQTAFLYDGLSRLRERQEYIQYFGGWLLNSQTDYVFDGNLVVEEVDENTLNPQVAYTRGGDLSGTRQGAGGIGGLLARSTGFTFSSGNWTTHYYYHADGNGNVTALEATNQTLAGSYRYDPFGNTTYLNGTIASQNIYRFSSKEVHLNTGTYYYGYRFYDPGFQRWLNRDAIEEEGGINLYGFVRNAPTDRIDTDGEADAATVAAGGGMLGALGEAGAYIGGGLGIGAAGVAGVAAGTWLDQNTALGGIGAGLANWWCPMSKPRGKGERNWAHESDKPWKGFRIDPKDPTKIRGKDNNGKDVVKPRPPNFPGPK